MIGSFRSVLGSKYGKVGALAFLVLIFFAFASTDVSQQMSNIGSTNGEALATVDGKQLTVPEMQRRLNRALDNLRQQNPSLTMQQFIEQGGIEAVYDELVGNMALSAYAEKYGIRPSKAQIDAEIASNPAFQDAAGKFSQQTYEALLQRAGINETAMRQQVAEQLILRQALIPGTLHSSPASGIASPYAALLMEARQGRVAALPSGLFASSAPPSDAEISAFYKANTKRFMLPESRKLRYAVIDRSAIAARSVPTDAEIAAHYEKNKADFAARETRTFRQLIVASEQDAKAFAQQVASGQSLSAVAEKAGLATSAVNNVDKASFARESGQNVADQAFAARQGSLVGPVKGELGWQILFVEAVVAIPGQTLDQARPSIAAIVQDRKAADALSALTSRIDDLAADGSTLDDIAKATGLTVAETPFVAQQGMVVDGDLALMNDVVPALLKDAFAMDPDADPQITTIAPDQKFAVIDVTDVRPSAPAPLDKIKPQVAQALRLSEGVKKAAAAVETIKAAVAKGDSFEAALAKAGANLPPVEAIDMRRIEIARQGGQVPPALQLLFSMKQGTAKSMAIPGDQGYLLVFLDKIVSADTTKAPELVAQTREQLAKAMGNEYGFQLRRAIEVAMGTERNAKALAEFKNAMRQTNGAAP